jgi:hypothetical protein
MGEQRPYPEHFHSEKNALSPEVQKILSSGQKFYLLSLDPDGDLRDEDPGKFHGYRILRKIEIREPEQRTQLLKALSDGIADSNGLAAGCFDPRNGISATLDGQTADLLICFECLQIWPYSNNARQAQILTSRLPRSIFNRLVQQASNEARLHILFWIIGIAAVIAILWLSWRSLNRKARTIGASY